MSAAPGRIGNVKPSQRHSKDADLLTEFRNAYVELLNSARKQEGRLFLPELGPKVDLQTWMAKRADVATAAGAVADIYPRYGGTFSISTGGYIRSVDPVANWEIVLRDPEQLRPEVVLSAVESAISRARQSAADAADRERGITGLVAAFLRWPSNLREAVGRGRAQRRAAGVIGVFGQLLVATIGGALAIGVAAGAVSLWRAVL